MNIELQNLSIDLDEPIDADAYDVHFVAAIKNASGIEHKMEYHRSHENGPGWRESVRDIVQRGVQNYGPWTAFYGQKYGIILQQLDIRIQK